MGCLWLAAASANDDFETFVGFSTSVGRSQSLQPEPSNRRRSTFDFLNDDDDDNADQRNKRQAADVDLGHFKRISAQPTFTKSEFYISPADADRRYTRSPQGGYKNVYSDGYQAFLDKYFSKDDEDDGTDAAPAKHRSNDNGYEKQNSNYRQSKRGGGGGDDVEHIDRPEHSDGYSENNNDDEYERIKTLSQQQEKEIKQNPKHCKVVVKNDMKCSLCKNPETGAHSESCSFSSTPAEKKYAYIKERNYNSKDDEDEDDDDDDGGEEGKEGGDDDDEKNEEASNKNEAKIASIKSTSTTTSTTEASPRLIRRRGRPLKTVSSTTTTTTSPTKETPRSRQTNRSQRIRATSKPTTSTSTSHRFSSSYKAEESRPQERTVIGLDPFLYGSADGDKEKSKRNTGESTQGGRSYEDYFSHVFPEAKNGKLKRSNHDDDEVELLPDYDSKKNVEKVLAEFKTKDWSTCKKVQKGDLTCYHCKDERGVRHEECMFVSGSAANHQDPPKSSRLSYSETKEYHHNPNDDNDDHQENDDGTVVASSSKLVSKTIGEERGIANNKKVSIDDAQKKHQSNRKKASRKLVIRKRKAKVIDLNAAAAPKPEDVENYHAEEKKTIKRMVSYVEEESSRERPDLDQTKSVLYEHHIQHDG